MIRFATILAVLAIVGSTAFGFEVGDTVIAIRNAEIVVDDRTVDTVFPGLALKVDAIRGDALWVSVDGAPAGFAELDRRQPYEVELVQFGLMPEFIGQGLGKWFLQWTIDKAWGYEPQRFWLHTCTLDHSAALPNYLKAGFTLFKQEAIRREL